MVYSLQQFRHLLQSYWGKISSCSRLNCLSSSFSSAHIFKKVRNIQFSSSCFSAASLTLFGSIILICTSFSASEISVSKFSAAETWIGGPDSLILSENRLTRHPNEKFPAWFQLVLKRDHMKVPCHSFFLCSFASCSFWFLERTFSGSEY